MPEMYMMCGPPGAGKTMYAKAFAKKHGLVYYGVDDFYALFHGSDTIHKDQFEVWSAIFRVLHNAEVNGVDCMFDTNNATLVDRIQLLDWFPLFKNHLIFIGADFAECSVNNKSRRRCIPEDDMVRLYDKVIIPRPDEDERYASITYYWSQKGEFKEATYEEVQGRYVRR